MCPTSSPPTSARKPAVLGRNGGFSFADLQHPSRVNAPIFCAGFAGTDAVKLRTSPAIAFALSVTNRRSVSLTLPITLFLAIIVSWRPLLSEGKEMPKTITVTNMTRASHLADGSMVEMEFAGSNGEKFALRFSPDKLESFVAQARQLLFSARSQKLKAEASATAQKNRPHPDSP
jgi:uncharacterized protein (DUF58 family)